ncbi:hypothetical protein CEXT_264401 [Caerostris extrusa]|uniref:Uncharacterized protein n=1 Tax=Caerostris extrusa TaxID=172846 RepID=A0AAV4RS73_CAEEX|nr:hypothetical protein CEXT_264401 [Caerostris extrusa]
MKIKKRLTFGKKLRKWANLEKRDQELSEIRDRTLDRETHRMLLEQKKLIPVFPAGFWIAFSTESKKTDCGLRLQSMNCKWKSSLVEN